MEPGVTVESKEKTAFSTPYGLCQFVTLPFVLFEACATFQCLMNWVLRPLTAYAATYLEDVVIHNNVEGSMCSGWPRSWNA